VAASIHGPAAREQGTAVRPARMTASLHGS